jgi:diphthine-ammonia ligase
MLSAGIEAMIVSCNPALGEEFLGTFLTPGLIPILESKGVDVCGENGEFHTIVVNCPLFSRPVKLPQFSKIKQGDYYFINWEVEE